MTYSLRLLCAFLLLFTIVPVLAQAQVKRVQKISQTEGGYVGLSGYDGNRFRGSRAGFGKALANVGDFDGDGVSDLAVGVDTLVQLLYLNEDGTVKAQQDLFQLDARFSLFSIANIGDLNDDGVTDLAIGDPNAGSSGSVTLLFLNSDGSLQHEQRISDAEGGFDGDLGDDARFGWSVANLGDLDGDGISDLVVGAPRYDALWILFFNGNGTVKEERRIDGSSFKYPDPDGDAVLDPTGSWWGASLANLGDLDGDGVVDLAVGSPYEQDLGFVWLIYLNSDGTLKNGYRRYSDRNELGLFGSAVAGQGDLNGDGTTDLAVGAPSYPGWGGTGKVLLYFLTSEGSTKEVQEISEGEGGFTGELDERAGYGDEFGYALANLGDLDGDGAPELAVGAPRDDDGAPPEFTGDDVYFYDGGAVWILFMDPAFAELPVELVAFDLTLDGGDALLSWQTASEQNNAGFEVQRKAGEQFEAVGFVEGHGTTAEPQRYEYRISSLAPGRHYFRLKQVDAGGAFAYSAEVEAVVEAPGGYHLSAAYPNPFNPRTQFELTISQAQRVRVEVFDMLGRRVVTALDGEVAAQEAQIVTIEGAGLPSGTYLIRAVGEAFTATQQVTLVK